MPESRSFSIGVDRLLQEIRPYGRTQSCYPPNLSEAQSRRKGDESLQEWFVRMVDHFCNGEPKRVALEDNLAVFVCLRWLKKRLSYASIQTVSAACDLDDYYLGTAAEAIYLRLDFDYKTLGEPFSHPLAHIHLENELSPRFPLDGGNSGNIIVDYLEFLYRTYLPEKWLRWVRKVWSDEFAGSAKEGDVDPLPIIVDAFATSQFHIMRDYATQMERIKKVLRKRKDDLFDLRMDGSDRLILEYPSAARSPNVTPYRTFRTKKGPMHDRFEIAKSVSPIGRCGRIEYCNLAG